MSLSKMEHQRLLTVLLCTIHKNDISTEVQRFFDNKISVILQNVILLGIALNN
jgi:hypothetical protein